MRVKICGITRVSDAQHAEACGAYAIGVVMYSDSDRSVSMDQAREIFASLQPSTLKVAVTHSTSENDMRKILSLHPDAVQISYPFSFPKTRAIKVFRVITREDYRVSRDDTDFIVVDESRGSGREFNPDFACKTVRQSPVPVVLAGGLTPENVRSAIERVKPAIVDVASGVESMPGIKDNEKVREFLACCRDL
jgi:phosphoribosylanthranilate isomerase